MSDASDSRLTHPQIGCVGLQTGGQQANTRFFIRRGDFDLEIKPAFTNGGTVKAVHVVRCSHDHHTMLANFDQQRQKGIGDIAVFLGLGAIR